LQFLAAVVTRTALEDATGLELKLKWPNDLVLGNFKLGGILIESKTQGAGVSFAILGIGWNINEGKAQLPAAATSVRLVTGKQYELRAILTVILDQLSSSYDDLHHPSRSI